MKTCNKEIKLISAKNRKSQFYAKIVNNPIN